ncbi:MAG TPA: FHA domain-containing protein [Dehalococcoidia bacterium]|jgi:pSer/pThr/pTyr-binding forkhead associated (FHA) protein|nr:FHA domain-containing protein [Dehalococcoidia bacterium]
MTESMMVEVGAAATLLVRGGPNNGVTIKLTGRPITLDTPRGFVLRDLNTANGTFINRHRIGQNERLL